MTREAKDMKDAFYREARRASAAIDAALAEPIAQQVQRCSGERGAVVEIARDLREAAGNARAHIEYMLRGHGVREVRS